MSPEIFSTMIWPGQKSLNPEKFKPRKVINQKGFEQKSLNQKSFEQKSLNLEKFQTRKVLSRRL